MIHKISDRGLASAKATSEGFHFDDTMTGRKKIRKMEEEEEADTVAPSSRSVMAALEASNKPLIVGEHELFLLRG